MTHVLFGSGVYVLLGIFFVYLLYPRDAKTREIMAQFRRIHPMVPFITVVLAVLAWPWYAFTTLHALWRKPMSPEDEVKSLIGDPDFWKKREEEHVEKVNRYVRDNPTCGRCGALGGLARYHATQWVICATCGGRTCTFNPGAPESLCAPLSEPNSAAFVNPARCWICGGVAEAWMPMREVASGPKYSQLEKVCYSCAKSNRARGKC